ncbi:MAG: MYXO-CTERM sorting domain-containing protein, partial [Myxococcota bacterium]
QALIDDSAHLTRLTSSISPVEMTVDPTFVFNADMEQSVPLERSAMVELLCEEGKAFTDVERRLVLADGRAYRLPSMQWFWDRGTTEYEFLSGLMDDFALLIERTSGEGPPVPLYDGRERAVEIAEDHNATFGPLPGACGCSSTTGPVGASLGLAGALGLVLLRRRRR